MSVTDTILNTHELNEKELEALAGEVALHPYYHAAALSLTHALYCRQSADYGATLRRTAISIPDRSALFALIEGRDYQLGVSSSPRRTSRQEGVSGDRTTSLIDHFLGTLPEEKPRRLTAADAASDYMSYLMQSEARDASDKNSPMRGQSLIDDFIGSNGQGERIILADGQEPSEIVRNPRSESPSPVSQNNDEEELSPEYFTETMARIYIKQGKFEKASKIIERLNAKYPKKNRYFADQMRFLEKLMLNQRYSKH